MKKVLILLLLLIVACGGTSQEVVVEDTTTTTLQDTTTTTIPPAPTIDFNIVEIYNKKLGTELCSDAKEIDTTSEECLKQYRDNLETVFSYAENLETYISELNKYFESYPSAMTQEYTSLFQFVNNEYQAVPETYGIVADKYIERFGGEPQVLNIDYLNEAWNSCPLKFLVQKSENLKSGEIIYSDNFNNEIKINLNSETINLPNIGGNFYVKEINATNFLGETYVLTNDKSSISNLYINHWLPMLHKLNVYQSGDKVTFELFYSHGIRKLDRLQLIYNRGGISSVNIGFSLFSSTYIDYGVDISNSYDVNTDGLLSWEISENKISQTYDLSVRKDLGVSENKFFIRHMVFNNGFGGSIYQDTDIFFFLNGSFNGIDDYIYSYLYGCDGESSLKMDSEGGAGIPLYISNLIDNSSFVFNR